MAPNESLASQRFRVCSHRQPFALDSKPFALTASRLLSTANVCSRRQPFALGSKRLLSPPAVCSRQQTFALDSKPFALDSKPFALDSKPFALDSKPFALTASRLLRRPPKTAADGHSPKRALSPATKATYASLSSRGSISPFSMASSSAFFTSPDAPRRRDPERLHDLVADAARQRRHLGVLRGERGDALLELLDLLEAAALLLGALGRDVGAREAEQVVQVLAELAREAADGAVGPVGSYWLARRWCRMRKRTVSLSAGSGAKRARRRSSLSNMRVPTSAWPRKWTLPSGGD